MGDSWIDELLQESAEFLEFFRATLDEHIAQVSLQCGYTDRRFVAVIDRMFEDPDVLMTISVEHRVAISIAYAKARYAWAMRSV